MLILSCFEQSRMDQIVFTFAIINKNNIKYSTVAIISIAKIYKTLTLHKNLSHLEGFKENQRKNVK